MLLLLLFLLLLLLQLDKLKQIGVFAAVVFATIASAVIIFNYLLNVETLLLQPHEILVPS